MNSQQAWRMSSLTALLAAHMQITTAEGLRICMCGDWMANMPGGSPGDDERHRAHLADAIRAHLADVAGLIWTREATRHAICLLWEASDERHLEPEDEHAAADAAVGAYLRAIGDQP